MTAALKWIACLAVAGSIASSSASPQAAEASPVTRTPADAAGQFLSDLIANVTEAEQQQRGASQPRLLSCAQDESLVVDLGYAKYRGYHNSTTGLNYWKGSEQPHSDMSRSCCSFQVADQASDSPKQNPLCRAPDRKPQMEAASAASSAEECSRYRRYSLWSNLPAVVAVPAQCALHSRKRGLPLPERLCAPKRHRSPRPNLHSRRRLWLRRQCYF